MLDRARKVPPMMPYIFGWTLIALYVVSPIVALILLARTFRTGGAR